MTATIIMPVYNGTRYLADAIHSVCQQSYPDWKLFVVDDGSSDDPESLIRQQADPRILYIRRDRNTGLYPTLLHSFYLTDTEWVSILMQDDRLKPTYLTDMINLSQRYPAAQSIWGTEDIIGSDGQLLRSGQTTRREELIQPGTAPWASALRRGCIWTISGSFTKRGLLHSIPFRSDLPHCADYDWLLRAIRQVPLLYFDYPLVELRQHGEQASAYNLRSGRDVEESYQVVRQNLSAHGHELSRVERLRICARRSKVVLSRAARNCARLRFLSAQRLLAYGVKFLRLSVTVEDRVPRTGRRVE